MRSSIPRVRSVRFKDGRALVEFVYRALRPETDHRVVRSVVEALLDKHGSGNRITALAIVIWDEDLNATAAMATSPRCKIPTLLLPDLARITLIAQKVSAMTINNFDRDGEE